jgi:hypothetical protein
MKKELLETTFRAGLAQSALWILYGLDREFRVRFGAQAEISLLSTVPRPTMGPTTLYIQRKQRADSFPGEKAIGASTYCPG